MNARTRPFGPLRFVTYLTTALVLLGTGRAFAQGDTVVPAVPPAIPGLARPDIPRIKPGGLPARPGAKRPFPSGAPKDGDDTPKAGGDTRRLPPPGVPRSDRGDSSKDSDGTGGTPKWKQDEGGSVTPTLSKDFIKNCEKIAPNVKMHLEIYDEELEAVVKLIACMTGKNIILSKSLKGSKITIYSPSPVTSDEAYRAFLSALEVNGKTISQSGKFLKIIDIKDYVKGPDPIRAAGTTPPNEDRMVTQFVPLRHVDAQEMNDVLSKLATPHATFIVYAPSNALIISEVASNLRKLLELIKNLDVPGGEEQLFVYQVLHADASDIASKVTEIFEQKDNGGKGRKREAAAPAAPATAAKAPKAGGSAATSSIGESDQSVRIGKILSDERTNRLLIVSTQRSYRQIKNLIAKLDLEIPGDGQVHIHQLNHAKAEDLAGVLGNLSSDSKARTGTARGGKAAPKGKTPAAEGGASGGGAGGGAALFEGEVKISPDEATNSLVVTASFKDYLSLKKVIEQLDRPRRQVFLEAIIMEVSLSNNRNVGLGFHTGVPGSLVPGEKTFAGAKVQPGSASSLNLADAATLQGIAVLAGTTETLPLGAFEIPAFGAVLQALATSSDANILSTPNILTTDNEEAEIVVGSNVPFVTQSGLGGLGGLAGLAGGAGGNAGQLAGLLGGGLGGVQIQRQDVALTLKITPRINAAKYVTLEVDQVVEEIEANDEIRGPTTSKRSVKTTVVVKDQRTVVIGGLQKNVQNQTNNKVPILGEIPILGYLFRDSATRHERRNLILMLTPHVIESEEDFREIFRRKMEAHREFVARFHKEGENFVVGIDYAKKHGALEAIHKSVKKADDEQKLIDEMRRQQEGPPLPQDQDGVPLDDSDPALPQGALVVPQGNEATAPPDDTPPPESTPATPPPPPASDGPDGGDIQ